ncbi:MAG: hypothetical protein O7A03_06420, partial [Alphaproteobacteria bacterium]|nr:hypothetical protein [Alphaproteobacteria bacterium]
MSATQSRIRTVTALAAALIGFAGAASAQPGITPPTVQPDILIEPPDQTRTKVPGDEVIITTPDSEPGPVTGSPDKLFVLREVVVDGSTIYDHEDLAPIMEQYVGEEVSEVDLKTIVRAITLKYRRDGYVLSQAILPPQEFDAKEGIVQIRVIEGRISNVEIDGEYRDLLGLIRKMANRIPSDGPFNQRDMERYLLLIDDLPGIRARGVVRPGDETGTGTLVIEVTQKTFEGSVGFDNLGSRFVGPYRGTLVAAVNSALWMHDRTTVRGIITGFEGQSRELRFGEVMQEFQVGSNGLRIRARGAITDTKPGADIAALRVQGESYVAEIQALYPLIRSRQFNIIILAGFKALESKSTVLG